MSYISREEGSKKLGVSTRTIDRYVKKGKIGYKKIANKVMLLEQDVLNLLSGFSTEKKEPQLGEVIHTSKKRTDEIQVSNSSLSRTIDNKLNQFFTIFQETDKKIQEKDKIIFALQQKIGEMEAKMSSMIALPDYSEEKQNLLIEKQKLSDAMEILKKRLKTEKTKSTIRIGFLVLAIVLGALLIYLSKL